MKRPYIHFYVGDWTANSNLRRCSFHERGIWIDVLCLMHDSDEVGILRWSLKEIAKAVGCREKDLRGLVEKGVMRGIDGPEESKKNRKNSAEKNAFGYTHVCNKCEAFFFNPKTDNKHTKSVLLIPEQVGPIWYSSRMVIDEYKRSVQSKNASSGANVVNFERQK